MKHTLWVTFVIVFVMLSTSIARAITLPVSSVTLGDTWTKTARDGRVTQWFEIGAPARVSLNFNPCFTDSGCLSAADLPPAIFDCRANRYIPAFDPKGILPTTLSVTAPPGSRPEKIFLKAGPAPGFTGAVGYYDEDHSNDYNEWILKSAPTVGSDGRVTLNFAQAPFSPSFASALGSIPYIDGQVCGVSREEAEAITKAARSFDNSMRAYYKIAIVWSRPNSCCASNQKIEFNGKERTDLIGWSSPDKSSGLSAYRQNDRTWSATEIGGQRFSQTGTVASAVATALSRFGATTTPVKLGQQLAEKGVWRPGIGSDWNGLQIYLRNEGYAVREIDLITLAERVGGEASFLMTFDRAVGRPAVVVITDYDSEQTSFRGFDPARGHVTFDWEEVTGGNPWILQISRQ